MSWNAYLHCNSCGHTVGEFNFTHNTNRMITEATPTTWSVSE